MAVMLTGVYYCMKAEIPAMLERGGGRHRQHRVGGRSRRVPEPGGLHRLEARRDRAHQGRRPRLRRPGRAGQRRLPRARPAPPWSTGPLRHDPSIDEHLQALHPIGRIGEASEVAEAAVWLCTPAASFVLGVALPVDGGYVVAVRTTETTGTVTRLADQGHLIGDAVADRATPPASTTTATPPPAHVQARSGWPAPTTWTRPSAPPRAAQRGVGRPAPGEAGRGAVRVWPSSSNATAPKPPSSPPSTTAPP